ncbi:MAG: hypothetical protein AAGA18_00960 [Verrucomicrobiota bacterium]
MKNLIALLFTIISAPYLLKAQAPGSLSPQNNSVQTPTLDRAPTSKQKPSSAEMMEGNSNFLGKDIPLLDFGTDMVTWDGKTWNVNNQRVFRARFEKYLNAPEQTSEDQLSYQTILRKIYEILSPGNLRKDSVNEAFELLPQASSYRTDANLCDSLAGAIYSVWVARKNNHRLELADAALKKEDERLRWNASLVINEGGLSSRPSANDKVALEQWKKDREMKRDLNMQPYLSRLSEIEALKKTNFAKREASKLQKKIEFQGLLVQYFIQRRFQHVQIGTRFYRTIFGEGDTTLQLDQNSAAAKSYNDYVGMPPTIDVLESMAHEAIRDIEDGVDAFKFLLEKEELHSATERLGEIFLIGEFMPPVRHLARNEKRKALAYAQLGNRLLAAMEVKDYAAAEKLIAEMENTAKDFDSSKPMAKIETARTLSRMHLNKAKTAAVSGMMEVVEEELRQATEIWPRNPELAKVSAKLFEGADVQQQALKDLDRLVSQKNYRQIFEDKVKFIAATALYPDKQDVLKDIIDRVTKIEAAIIRAEEVANRGDHAGAWESVERVYIENKAADVADSKLSEVRANMTTHAPEFVQSLRKAQALEEKDQVGSSLAWYLQARRLYPMSDFAKEGIRKMVDKILPDDVGMEEFSSSEEINTSADTTSLN